MTPGELILITAVVGVGSFVQGSVGFGLNLIAAPVLVLVDPDFIPGPAIAAALVLTLLVMVRDRAGVRMGEVGLAFAGRLPGSVLGAVIVAVVSQRALSILFGLALLAGVVMTASGARLAPTSSTLLSAGLVSGFMGTSTSVGGPPMALLYAGSAGAHLRGTLSTFFVAGASASLALLAAVGEFGGRDLVLGALIVPGTVAGFALSGPGARFLDQGRTRAAVLGVSALAGASVLVSAL